ncbi:GNAT family N-acetyltransferase [Aquisalimonas sp. 2447]|uniref:GNAT family N-acetyltransferase n=1 Tax=Aquisalimonas sp. 2447 TaxID=2740807 RepID=UPI0014323B9C|nr:GNAT family N-acetyltransferase [Aquisalimonas sp. 2447]QIT54357.1 GNAT family N-acetyltransferase [Aquisalimonas sp. 2447]
MTQSLLFPMPWSDEPVIRRLWSGERTLWREHLLRLDAQARRDRFAGLVSDAFIRRYCDEADPFTQELFGAFVDGELRAVGEFALLDRDWPRRAELAFSVEGPWQNQGLGSTLFRRLLVHARNLSVSRAFIISEPGNARMHRIARKHGMTLTLDADEIAGRLELVGPSYFSVMEEVVEEGVAFWRQTPDLRTISLGR